MALRPRFDRRLRRRRNLLIRLETQDQSRRLFPLHSHLQPSSILADSLTTSIILSLVNGAGHSLSLSYR